MSRATNPDVVSPGCVPLCRETRITQRLSVTLSRSVPSTFLLPPVRFRMRQLHASPSRVLKARTTFADGRNNIESQKRENQFLNPEAGNWAAQLIQSMLLEPILLLPRNSQAS